MIEEISWAFAGICAGTIAGLVPGIHANTVAFLALSSPIEKTQGFCLFIISMSVANAIVDSVPSILLGAPSDENANIMLPGHEMLMKGNGIEAIMLSAFGGISAAIIAVALMPLFQSLASNYDAAMPQAVPLIVAASFLAMGTGEKHKVAAFALAILCGGLGVVAMEKIDNAIFVLITGFYGITGLAESIFTKTGLPRQNPEINGKTGTGIPLLATIASGFTAMFPGIGPTQATIILKSLFSGIGKKGYIVLIGAMNTGNLLFSLLMLFALEKGRSGMAVALQNVPQPDFTGFLAMLATALMAAGAATMIAEVSGKWALKAIRKINYRALSAFVLCMMLFVVFISSGAIGILACITASCLALFGISSEVRRSQCMTFLLFPTMLFYLGIAI